MGDARDLIPITIPMTDLAAIGLDDLWHVDEKGRARKLGGFDHKVGSKIITSLLSYIPEGTFLYYDLTSCDYRLELILH